MSNDEIVRTTVNIVVISGVVAAAVSLVAASIYDFKQTRLKKRAQAHPFARRLRARPLISIIIPTSNSQNTINACLQSIISNRYRKYQTVVVDDNSLDDTKRLVRSFIREHPGKDIRLIAKRKTAGFSKAIYSGANHASGELLMVLPASSKLDRNALMLAVRQFALLPNVGSVGLNVSVEPNYTILGLYERLEYLVRYQARKLNSLVSAQRAFEHGVIYKRQALARVQGQKALKDRFKVKFSYASEAFINIRPSSYKSIFDRQKRRSDQVKHGPSRVLQLYLVTMQVLAPFLFIYFIFEALYFKQVFLIGLTWAALTLFLILTIVASESYSRFQKLRLVFLSPAMYGPFFLATFIRPLIGIRNIVVLLSSLILKGPRILFSTLKRSVTSGVYRSG